MNTQNYFQQFRAGIELAGKLDKVFRRDPRLIKGFLDYIDDANSPKNANAYGSVIPIITDLARRFVARHDPIHELGRRCHSFSDAFNRGWRSQVGDKPIWLLLTIGEVKHRNNSIYDVTKSKVVDCVRRGFQPSETLGVHVWLTLEDMTIFDLTIMASLLRLGWISPIEYKMNPVVIGKSDELSDFGYTPYLVDNDFVAKVDRQTARL